MHLYAFPIVGGLAGVITGRLMLEPGPGMAIDGGIGTAAGLIAGLEVSLLVGGDGGGLVMSLVASLLAGCAAVACARRMTQRRLRVH